MRKDKDRLLDKIIDDAETTVFESGEEYEIPWDKTKNLDLLLKNVYTYYHRKGFLSIILSSICNLLSLAFVTLLSTFLLSFIDYNQLLITRNLNQSVLSLEMSRIHPFLLFYLIGCSFYWVYQLVSFIFSLKLYWDLRTFYNSTLKISENRLQTIEWSEVVEALCDLHKKTPLCYHKNELTSLDIVHRIERKENFMIALITENVLPLNLPLPYLNHFPFVTTLLEKIIEFTLDQTIFIYPSHSSSFNTQRDFKIAITAQTTKSLQFYFRLIGFLTIIFSPFIIVYLISYFIFKYGEELRNRPDTALATRQWSKLSQWKIKQYNELPHVFEMRLALATPPAYSYLNEFQSNALSILSRFGSFVLGSIVVVLIGFAIIDEEILLDSDLGGKSLIWYLGICGTLLGICRSLIIDKNKVFDAKQYLNEIVKHTGYKPDTWIGKENDWEIRDAFTDLFEYKIFHVLKEGISIFFGPLILIFSVGSAQGCQAIVKFFETYTEDIEGIGSVCRWANFETGFETVGDEDWGSQTTPSASTTSESLKGKYGKMEKSFIGFVKNFPKYQASGQGEKVLENLTSFVQKMKNQGGEVENNALELDLKKLDWGDLHQSFHESMLDHLTPNLHNEDDEEKKLVLS